MGTPRSARRRSVLRGSQLRGPRRPRSPSASRSAALRGPRRAGRRLGPRRAPFEARSRKDRPRGHDRRRHAAPGARTRRADERGRLPRPQHSQHRLRECLRSTRSRCDDPRRLGWRPRRVSVRTARDGEHRHRGPRLHARGRRRRDRRRPGCADRNLGVARGGPRPAARGQVYRAGSFSSA